MMRKILNLGIVLMLSLCSSASELVGRWSFDHYDGGSDYGKLLIADVGGNASFRYNGTGGSWTYGEGLYGSFRPVNDGLPTGDWGVAVPLGYHLGIPIGSVSDVPWCLEIRFMTPSESQGKWRSLLQIQIGNGDDGDLFINQDNKLGGGLASKYSGSYETVVTPDVWHTLKIKAADSCSAVYLDGDPVCFSTASLKSALNNSPTLLLCADNNGEDALVYLADVAFYKGADVGVPTDFDGSTATGDYTISSAEQLRLFSRTVKATAKTFAGSTFTLTADIDLGGQEWQPIGTFNGVFDGAGHTISNLVISQSTTDDVGLFSILKNATIKNLSIRGGRIEGRNRVGGIAGRVNGGTVIEDCTTDLEIVASNQEAGGLVGYLDGTGNNRFTRCRTLGPVTSYAADERAGGLFGKSDGSFTADSCYSSGAVTGYGTTGYVGGLLGYRAGGTATFTNSYSVSWLQGNYLTQGGSADDDIVGSGTSGVTVQSRPTVIDCFPKSIVNLAKRGNGSGTVSWNGNMPVATPDPGSVFIRWDNEIPEGEFNEITLYAVFGKAVASEADLRALPAKGFFKQTADITMSDAVFNGLHASPRFQGEYDGAGYAIRDLKVTAAGDNTGLFRTTQGAILKDIHLVGGLVTGGKHVGALIGAQNGGMTERCSASTVVRATGIHAAGLIGRADTYVTIRECWASGPVESTANYVGGLVSYISGNTSRIENCYARGDVKGDDIVGGFIGGADNSFAISNCYSSGSVDCCITAGGFYARNDGGKSVTGCFWDSTKAGQTRSTYGTGLATDAMFGSSAYDAWNADVWEFHANGYPTLKGMPNASPTPLATGCGKGTVSAVNNGNGTWTFTATPDTDSYFVRWGGLAESDVATPSVTVACDGSEAPTAVFGTCIRTVQEMQTVWANPDVLGCYRLDADLDFAGAGVRMTQVFEGLFDGNGHTISNLVLNLPTTDDVGLFSMLRNATIQNLSIRSGRIEGRTRVGGIAGRVNGGTLFEDCTTDLEVVAQGTNAGGLVGYLDGTGNNRFTRCRTLGPVTSYAESDRAGGLVAVTDSSFTIDSCYASGAITGYGTTEYVGGLLGWRFGGTVTVTNSYSVSRLQGNYLTQGGSTDDDIVGSGTSGVTVQSRPTVIDCFPKNIVNLAKRGNGSGTVSWNGNEPVATPDPGSVFIRWDNAIPEGEFNEITLYAVFGKAVATEADLRALPTQGFFRQTADITMSASPTFNGLHANPKFQGEYDGAGFAIRDLVVVGNGDNTGLFRCTQGAILKDIHLVGGKVSGGKHVGALIGAMNGGMTERCSASTAVRATGIHAAGLIGRADTYVTIRECWASGPVESAANYVGGLVSYISGNTSCIENSYARGDVKGDDIVGGFIGGADNSFVISNCYSSGKVDCGITAGGFFARNDTGRTVTGCCWDSTKAGQTRSTYGTGLATDAMFGSSAYDAWSSDVWEFHANGYPTLRAMANVSPTPLATGCGKGTVGAVNNGDGTWTFTATPDEGSYFVRWGGLTAADATAPSVTIACDGTEAPAAVFGTCIRTVAELEAVWANPDTLGCYRLDADLDFAGTGVRMIKTFAGTFDGNGHTISNLVLNWWTTDDVGLFSVVRGATIRNLSLRGGRVEGRNRVGGIAGSINGGTVLENCTVDLEVVGQASRAGGIIGYINSTGGNTIRCCRSLGPVTTYGSTEDVGGLFGYIDGATTVDSCYSSGSVTGHGTAGAADRLYMRNSGLTVEKTDTYSVSRLQGSRFGSGVLQPPETVLDCFPKNIVNLAKYGNGSGTVSWDGGVPVATPDEGSVFVRWDGEIPVKGDFNEITLYAVFGKAVATEADLRALPAQGFFAQTADITMTASPAFYGLHPNPRFQGEYDGAGFAINNLVVEGNNDNAGLFRSTQGAVLRNIRIVGGTVSGRHRVGALVGYQYGGLVEGCSSSAAVTATGDYGGGLIGHAESYATIRNSAATGSVTISGRYAGGLVAYTSGDGVTIHNCFARGDVKASSYAGGFISHADGTPTIINCYASGKVTAGSPVGGFYARQDTGRTISGCFWDVETSGQASSVAGSYGRTTAQMQTAATMAGWDTYEWKLVDGEYPELFALLSSPESYSVTWLDEDGTVLLAEARVSPGRTPAYTGVQPHKARSGDTFFSFDGWSPVPAPLESNVVYRATYRTVRERTWMDVDLRTGEVGYYDYDFATATNVFNTETYKSTKMAFRRISAGDEYFVHNGAYAARMTNSYYIALFETTAAQYAAMQNPVAAGVVDTTNLRAKGSCNRSSLRGVSAAPTAFGGDLHTDSPIGKFNGFVQSKTGNKKLVFDLPTEAMWEVAARAVDSGDETHVDWPWFFGADSTDLALYAFTKSTGSASDAYGNTSGTRVPGCLRPNAWGLYDVYGNVWELCLDGAGGNNSPEYAQGGWHEAPGGSGSYQRIRGGGYDTSDGESSSMYRGYHDSGTYAHSGFRLARICTPEEETSCTATWVDEDGTPLAEQTVTRGRTPRYAGALPTKASAGGTDYSFFEWSPRPSPLVSNTVYRATYTASRERTWMDVDLRTGVVSYHDYDFATATNVFNTETYKTTRMAFRRVEAGDDYFVQNGAYTALMTNSYYIGMFEVTVAQYALMKNPAAAAIGLRAQGSLNRSTVRGVSAAPAAFGQDITAGSPLGTFNAFVQAGNGDSGLVFDLPTEAMWEVAARAVDSGDETHADWPWFFGADSADLALYAFYKSTGSASDDYGNTFGTRVPGCLRPNAWGLYDVYGNVWELCLDGANGNNSPEYGQGGWHEAPGGSGSYQRIRGGGYDSAANDAANSTYRGYHDSGAYAHSGIRLARICRPDEEIVRPTHTVVWKDEDGTVLETDVVIDGHRVRFKGPTPTKPVIGTTIFNFVGWSPEVNPVVTADVVYTAVYQATTRPFICEDGDWTLEEDDSWRSAAIGDRGTTAVHLDVTGPGTLTFKWKVSSEGSYDFLNFYQDGNQIQRISGSTDWAEMSRRIDTATSVTFRWTYTKDGSTSRGSDCGWLKDLVWTPDGVVVPASVTGDCDLNIPLDWFDRYPDFAAKFGSDLNAAVLKPNGKTAADGSPMYVWQDYVNGCDPTDPEDVFRATIEMVDGVPYISWTPNLNTNETVRIYRILGKADLADPGEKWETVHPGHRFFKVKVEIPHGTAVSDEPGPVDVGGEWEPNLLCHLSFDDAGNGGLNVLKVQGGEDAVVRTTLANVVTGLGAVTVVTDPSILDGLEPGDGAVKIPLSTHIALPIPAALLDREGHPYTLKMRVKFPSFGRYYGILNMPGTNDSDDMVFLTNSGNPVIALKIMNKSYGQADGGLGGFAVNTWEELTFQFGETNTKILLNGNQIYSRDLNLAASYADCYDAHGCFVISGDNDNEDNEMYWADVKVYDGIVEP